MRTLTLLPLLLLAPGVAADHGDRDCWDLDEATGCYVEDTADNLHCLRAPDGAVCLATQQATGTGTYARRACDALTGQACTQP